jgi:hypothetical protein
MHLEQKLKTHKKRYQMKRHDPEGVISVSGLELCRMAIDRGFTLKEQPCLPLRFLPNFAQV